MSQFKGDNSTISLVVEDNGWGKAPSSYAGGKMLQNNDGTFNATRNALESEARTPNAELAGVRLGNKNVAGSFPVEVDPQNYSKLFESLFYGNFSTNGAEVVLTGVGVTSAAAYTLTIPVSAGEQSTLAAEIGSMYRLYDISENSLNKHEGVVVLVARTATNLTFMVPSQKLPTLLSTNTDVKIDKVPTLRPAKVSTSFNAEETLYSEDGSTTARFMTAGAVVSGASFDLPSEGTVKTTFSMIGADKLASKEYSSFDAALVDSQAAHTSVVKHTKYDPLVLQDGAIISNNADIRCRWLSGTVGIENGTEAFFVGCSYEAAGAISGKLRVTLNYEALFQSEDDYISFQQENDSKIMLKLKDRATEKCIVLYLPSFKATGYTINNATGLVTASVTGSAIVDPDSVNSIILGEYYA